MNSQCQSELPYVGMEPFTEDNAAFFFGREDWEEKIKQKLIASPLTFLCGVSGVGKSSLLRAGLVYHLRQQAKKNCEEKKFPGFGIIFFKSWNIDPLQGLIIRIQKSINGLLLDESQCDWPSALTLSNTLQLGMYRVGGSLLIILDQFEDYFSYKNTADNDSRFFNQLLDVINNSNLNVNILISIREESFAQLDIFKGHISGSLFENYLRLEHFNKDDIGKLITKPIEKYNKILKSKNLDNQQKEIPSSDFITEISKSSNIITEDNSRIETSYLQLVMRRLWDELWDEKNQRNSNTLSLKLLNKLGGVETIIKQHVDRAMTDFTPQQQDIAARCFKYLAPPSNRIIAYSIKELVDLNKENDELKLTSEQVNTVLEKLSEGKKRILRPKTPPNKKISKGNDERYYEIFHDQLAPIIRDWRTQYLRKIENRLHTIKQSLPSQSLRQLRQGQHELAAVLAYQAYRFNQEDKRLDKLDILDRVDEALREVLSKHFSTVIQQNEGEAAVVAFNSDGTLLAVGSKDGHVRLWHPSPRKTKPDINILPGDEQRGIASLAFSPDNKYLAVGCWDDHGGDVDWTNKLFLKVWNLHEHPPTSRILKSESGHWRMVRGLVFHPKQSNILVSGGHDGLVLLWDLDRPNEEPFVLEDRPTDNPDKFILENWVQSVAFNQEGDLLIVGGKHGLITLRHIDRRRRRRRSSSSSSSSCLAEFQHQNSEGSNSDGNVLSVAFNPSNNQILATAGDNKTICIWNLSQPTQPKCIQSLSEHVGLICSLAFSPDGKILASASEDQTIRLWDASQPNYPLIETLCGHYFGVSSIAFKPKKEELVLASGSWDETVRLWDLSQPIAEPKVLKGHHGNVSAVTFISDEKLVSGSWDKTVQVWDVQTGKPIDKPLSGHVDKVFSVAFYCSKDKQTQLIASAGHDKDDTVRIWNLCHPEKEPCILYHPSKSKKDRGVGCVAFSPDGQLLASGSKNNAVKLWNPNQFHNRDTPDYRTQWEHQESVTSVAFSPNGKLLASGSYDRTIRLWNVEDPCNWYSIHSWQAHDREILSVAFSPKGNLLASGSYDRTIHLWNITEPYNPQLIGLPLRGHNYWVSSVAFNQDGTKLASASYDGTIRIWDVSHPDMVPPPIMLPGHSQRICSVAFSPNGKILASASFDDTIRLWQVDTEFLADEVYKKVLRSLSEEEWKKFIGADIAYSEKSKGYFVANIE